MPPLHISNRLPQQVAADFTDVLHYLWVARAQARPSEEQGCGWAGPDQ